MPTSFASIPLYSIWVLTRRTSAMGNIQCRTGKHKSDDQKYAGVTGNSNGNHLTLTVDRTNQNAKDQHGQKY